MLADIFLLFSLVPFFAWLRLPALVAIVLVWHDLRMGFDHSVPLTCHQHQ